MLQNFLSHSTLELISIYCLLSPCCRSEGVTCGICLEVVKSKANPSEQRFGILSEFFVLVLLYFLEFFTPKPVTGPKVNSEFCCPQDPQCSINIEIKGKQNSPIPVVPVIKCFVLPPNSRVEKSCEEFVYFTPAGS